MSSDEVILIAAFYFTLLQNGLFEMINPDLMIQQEARRLFDIFRQRRYKTE